MDQAQYEQTLPSFDELVELAQNNPKGFEQFKRKACEQAIICASEEMVPRLRAQQSHIDRVINHCKNPYHINIVLARELSLQISKMHEVLEGDQSTRRSAEIIPFVPRH
ncbi:DUF3135 domain-containing protein [Vibrio sp. DW001]|uniref:DUF3135 domain-containing protein n=1 Tax=Vibrio sp. DW001 TaxID=2912315 RepID=UPI0023B19185|nr:DUF3135 domain-containing protein [Vibrio sp. DW001]WED26513.1 DUF3135 domain-containing protein [Vibrio sp. DW001]